MTTDNLLVAGMVAVVAIIGLRACSGETPAAPPVESCYDADPTQWADPVCD